MQGMDDTPTNRGETDFGGLGNGIRCTLHESPL
jgi:hypothetical protein